jgi:hypothetical protein
MALVVEPRLSRRFVFAIESLAQFYQVFLGVKEVQNAHRLGKEPLEKLFQTRAAVAERDVLVGRGPTDFQRLAVKLPSEVVKLEKAR